MNPRQVGLLVVWLVRWSFCHNFLKGQKVTLPCSYRSTYFLPTFLFPTFARIHSSYDHVCFVGEIINFVILQSLAPEHLYFWKVESHEGVSFS